MSEPGTIDASMDKSGVITIALSGSFELTGGCARCVSAQMMLSQGAKKLRYEASQLGSWDSSLVAMLFEMERHASEVNAEIDRSQLPQRLRAMLEMAALPGNRSAESPGRKPKGMLRKVGTLTTEFFAELVRFIEFAGNTTIAFTDLLRGRSKMRWKDFWLLLQNVTVEALPIVLLISFLVGVIIAFLGAVVLRRFGAEFAISYLVGYGILREMGAIMTGVIMAGRTGAAFAAQLGSMKVSEEIDALSTLGISPNEFLVLPRMVTLVIAMPLLTVFADVIGILGGYLVAVTLMGVPGGQFFSGLDFVAKPEDFLLGLVKGVVFGVLVATSGCMKGMQCKNSADAVGVAATKAVVLSITLIIFNNAIIDWAAAHFNI